MIKTGDIELKAHAFTGNSLRCDVCFGTLQEHEHDARVMMRRLLKIQEENVEKGDIT